MTSFTGRIVKVPQRVFLKVALAAAVVLPLAAFYPVYLTSSLRARPARTSYVSWGQAPHESVFVSWETESPASGGVVLYGPSPDQLVAQVPEPAGERTFHHVDLDGLKANTTYFYEVRVGGEFFSDGRFRTAPDPAAPPSPGGFTWLAFSDTQQKFGPGWHSALASALDGREDAFAAIVGDFVEDGLKQEWNNFFARAAPYLDDLPVVPVMGNHDRPRDFDGDGLEETWYFGEYFPQTEDEVQGTNERDVVPQFFFSFNWSNVHFQVLHFPEVDVDDEGEPGGVSAKDYARAFTPDHLAWMEADLAAAQSLDFRVTLFHCPYTGAGFYGPNHVLLDELVPLLQQYNVTLTLHGHAHHYERGHLENPFNPSAPMTYLVVGTGGGLADVGLRPVDATDVAIASPAYVVVRVTADQMNLTAVDLQGHVLDEFSVPAPGGGST
ncbi:MAG: hypothetical protein Kow0069_12010 [Promethearchaeota archaeon]